MATGKIIMSIGVAGSIGYLAYIGGGWIDRAGNRINPPRADQLNGQWLPYPPSRSHPGFLEVPMLRPLKPGETSGGKLPGSEDSTVLGPNGRVMVRLVRANSADPEAYEGGERESSYDSRDAYHQATVNRLAEVARNVNAQRGVTTVGASDPAAAGGAGTPTNWNKVASDYLPWGLAGGGALLAALGGGSTMTLVLGGLLAAGGVAMGVSNGAFSSITGTPAPAPTGTGAPQVAATGTAPAPGLETGNLPSPPSPVPVTTPPLAPMR